MTEKKSTTTKGTPTAKDVATTAKTTVAAAAKAPLAGKSAEAVATPQRPPANALRTTIASPETHPSAPTRRNTAATKESPAKPNPEERYRMIQEAAYFIAEKDGFSGPAIRYWAIAEREIAVQLGESEA